MLKELHDIAGQHEVIAENLNVRVVKTLQSLITELKADRKKVRARCGDDVANSLLLCIVISVTML